MNHIKTIAQELGLNEKAVEAAVNLIDEGNTIPFIARYRKEVTGSLDDSVLRTLDEKLTALRNLAQRKQEVQDLIGAQGKLTEEVRAAIEQNPLGEVRKTNLDTTKQELGETRGGISPDGAEMDAGAKDSLDDAAETPAGPMEAFDGAAKDGFRVDVSALREPDVSEKTER